MGAKARSTEDRNKARCLLASAPLMVAQLGALEFNKKMMTGNVDILRKLHLSAHSTVGELLQQLADVPPIALLKLFNKDVGDFIMNNMIQHSEDLDYVQDVLTTVGNHEQLNPSKFAVLEGFNRRRNFGRFKFYNHSIDLDRLRFAHVASPHDNDSLRRNSTADYTANSRKSSAFCHFFQRRAGCKTPLRCRFTHKCVICGSRYHGASECKSVKRYSDEKSFRRRDPHSGSNRRVRAFST